MRKEIVAKNTLEQEVKAWADKNASKGLNLKALTSALAAVETAHGKRKALAEQVKDLAGQEKLAAKDLKAAFETAKAAKKTVKTEAKTAAKSAPKKKTENVAKPTPVK